MGIEDQKVIADELLAKIELIDKNAILAGGAPRDWWAGVEANDLDFYLYFIPENGIEHTRRTLEFLTGIELKYLGADENYEGGMKELQAVLDGTYKGQKVQFMLMSKPTFSCVIPHFGASTSMVWYKGKRVTTSPEFLISLAKKTLYIKTGTKQAFIDKTVLKYSRLTVEIVDSIDKAVLEAGKGIHIWELVHDELRKLLRSFRGNV